MLHAAAFDPRINKLVLEGMLVSYDAIVTQRIHRQMFEQIVPSVLKSYDLPDLASSLAPATGLGDQLCERPGLGGRGYVGTTANRLCSNPIL
jgi:hypothetical protein